MTDKAEYDVASAQWGAAGVLVAGIAIEAAPLLVFTAANLWILCATYVAWSGTCASAKRRAEVRARIFKYMIGVLGIALAVFIKAHAPTAVRLGITDSVLATGAVVEAVVSVVLVYWASLSVSHARS